MLVFKKNAVRLLFIMLTLTVFSITAKAQTDQIEGLWYNDVKSGKIEITRHANGKFYGRVVWLREPNEFGKPKVDRLNEDPKLRTRPLNGKTYSCKITYKGKELDIRGYIGISLFGRTTTWTRVE
jgi:uncharacterized protein (DUF2147 family)